MMYSLMNGRNQRNRTQLFNPMHHPFANFCTETLQKSEMKFDYDNEIFLNNLHLIPDPLMKNLADTLITAEKPDKPRKQSLEIPKMPSKPSTEDARVESSLAGIANFFSGVFNMLSGVMFKTKSPVHPDCFDAESRQGSPRNWHEANDQDKNGLNKLSDESIPNDVPSDMKNCETVVSCEEKLNQVKCLLSKPKSNSVWRKRPKRVFVDPGSVDDSFEDAFSPEDFVSLPNTPCLEHHSPPQFQIEDLCETEAAKTKIDVAPVKETMEIVKEVTVNDTTAQNKSCDPIPDMKLNVASKNIEDNADDKHQLVSSCEDKLSKLKALLKEKRTKNTKVMDASAEVNSESRSKTIPISKPIDKHYKNPHRMLDKRQKMKMKRSIQDDVIFANEIDIESVTDSPSTPSTVNSSDTSLGEYFDELKGRFRTASTTESEDSFQIVFNDSPKPNCRASDCESEDSFIVFEDTDCYTSNDVFGESDSDSDVSDSGCSTMTCKLSHSLSRTVSNLTDDTLYESSDEVDCVKVEPLGAKGLLMDADKRRQRIDQPAKKVHFSEEPPTVRVMRVWAFAARQARAGHWERYALDRERFKRRIADVDMAVSWVLKPQHRSRVMFQRFMPMWNRQRRQELAEKKEKEAEDKRIEAARMEEERMELERLEEKRIEEGKEDVKESVTVNNDTVNVINKDNVKSVGINKNCTQSVSEAKKQERTYGLVQKHERKGQVDSSKSKTYKAETKKVDGLKNGEIVICNNNSSRNDNLKITKDKTNIVKDQRTSNTKCNKLENFEKNNNNAVKDEENSQNINGDGTDKLSADVSSKSVQPTGGLGKF